MSVRAMGIMRGWNALMLGLCPEEKMMVANGLGSRIDNGQSGAIYVDNDCVEAIGLCGVGGRQQGLNGGGVNEDCIGVAANRSDAPSNLLFGVADGMGGHEGGEVASSSAIASMESVADSLSFADGYEQTLQRMEESGVPKRAGTTYAGLLLPTAHDKARIGIIGDSRIVVSERGKPLYVSVVHTPGYRFSSLHLRFSDVAELMINRSRYPGAREWLGCKDAYSEEQFLVSARLLYEYILSSGEQGGLITRYIGCRRRFKIDEASVPMRSGLIYFLYSDGVGNLFTPYDIAAAFGDAEMPLLERARSFANDVIAAQCFGRELNVGIGPPLPVEGVHDNFSFWAVRVK